MTDPIANIRDVYDAHIKRYGTGLAGAAFGLGWAAWADAIIMSPSKVGIVKWLPGLGATLALLMINSVRLDEYRQLDPWEDEGMYCRSRIWLLIAYCICGGSIFGAGAIMIAAGGGGIGLSIIIQVCCILGAALLFFISRSGGESSEGEYGLL